MPRNAAQLRAAAIATGWFEGPQLNYVGDGYSIPWQTGLFVSPLIGWTLQTWKSYLDTYYLEPSRLHDWLYTHYGPDLIQCTQEEADLALREEMLAAGIDAAQAEVVYQACHIGGSPWYGVSSVGYVSPPLDGDGSNIGGAPSLREGVMANWKVVVVFQQTTAGTSNQPSIGYATVPRTAGWSESHWQGGSTINEVQARLFGPRTDTMASAILPARAGALNQRASILGVRLYEGGVGRGQFIARVYTGFAGGGDVPSMSLLCASTNASTPSVRRFTMRGMPDGQIVDGEFAPTTEYTQALRVYFQSLVNTSFTGRDPVTELSVFNISNAGLVTYFVAPAYAVGTIITVKQTVDSNGFRRTGQFQVASVGPLGTQLTLAAWPYGACTNGKTSVPTTSLYAIGLNSTVAVRASNHKVGRPFAGYRGRNSNRRTT